MKTNFSTGNALKDDLMSLQSIAYTSFSDNLPWFSLDGTFNPEFIFPDYLMGIVDEETGSVDGQALRARVEQLEQQIYLQSHMGQ